MLFKSPPKEDQSTWTEEQKSYAARLKEKFRFLTEDELDAKYAANYEKILAQQEYTRKISAGEKAVHPGLAGLSEEDLSIIEKMEAAGGTWWRKEEKIRVYFNTPSRFIDQDTSNNKKRECDTGKLYYDVVAKKAVYTGSRYFEEEVVASIEAILTN